VCFLHSFLLGDWAIKDLAVADTYLLPLLKLKKTAKDVDLVQSDNNVIVPPATQAFLCARDPRPVRQWDDCLSVRCNYL
jgi:hypothetical protein